MRVVSFVTGLLLAASAFAATPEETVRQAMSGLAPNVKIDAVQESVVPGFYEAVAGGEFVYVTKDGRYVIDGNAWDIANHKDLTAGSRAKVRKIALDKIGPDKRIVFSPPAPVAPKHTVTVFTDVDCPFCRRFHQQIAAYNAKGIAQRPFRSYSYKNQSIMALAHRFLRDVPADGEAVLSRRTSNFRKERAQLGVHADGSIDLTTILTAPPDRPGSRRPSRARPPT